jgi:metal-sulfur cluster biosynthetic enzyme
MNTIEQLVIQKLKTIKDLELPVNIYELGLIYKISIENINEKVHVNIEMTTIHSQSGSTKPITHLVRSAVETIDEVHKCNIKFVFTPKWDLSMMSKEGLEKLRNAESLNYQM